MLIYLLAFSIYTWIRNVLFPSRPIQDSITPYCIIPYFIVSYHIVSSCISGIIQKDDRYRDDNDEEKHNKRRDINNTDTIANKGDADSDTGVPYQSMNELQIHVGTVVTLCSYWKMQYTVIGLVHWRFRPHYTITASKNDTRRNTLTGWHIPFQNTNWPESTDVYVNGRTFNIQHGNGPALWVYVSMYHVSLDWRRPWYCQFSRTYTCLKCKSDDDSNRNWLTPFQLGPTMNGVLQHEWMKSSISDIFVQKCVMMEHGRRFYRERVVLLLLLLPLQNTTCAAVLFLSSLIFVVWSLRWSFFYTLLCIAFET